MKYKFGFNFMWRPFYKRTQLERLYLMDEIPSAPGLAKGFADVGVENIISLEDTMVEILNYYRTQEKFNELWTPLTSKPTSTIPKRVV
jgi:hypothetical protein